MSFDEFERIVLKEPALNYVSIQHATALKLINVIVAARNIRKNSYQLENACDGQPLAWLYHALKELES